MDHPLAKWLVIVFMFAQISDEASAADSLLRIGSREDKDELLFEYELQRPFRYFLRRQDVLVEFPMNAARDKPETITMISVEPNSSMMPSVISANHVTVVAGGVGHDHVKLEFKSGMGRGLDYHITIYGVKNQANKNNSSVLAPDPEETAGVTMIIPRAPKGDSKGGKLETGGYFRSESFEKIEAPEENPTATARDPGEDSTWDAAEDTKKL